jgi:hypothetical protein
MRNQINYRRNTAALYERPFVMSGLYRSSSFVFVFAIVFTLIPMREPLRAQMSGVQSYRVLSVKPGEVLIRIQPNYTSSTVKDSAGRTFTEMTIPDGFLTDSAGAPELMRLGLPFLAPNRQQAKVEIVSQSLEVLPGIDLAPIPTTYKKNGDLIKQYLVREDRYRAAQNSELVSVGAVTPYRTAFSERITVSPIGYDAESRSVTRIKSLTLRVTFEDAASAASVSPSQGGVTISPEEAEFFRTIFINGSVTKFYTCASAEWTYALRSQSQASARMSTLSAPAASGQWLQLTTNGAGIYHISAQDLANNGITGTIDPTTIELFGIGGAMLNETATDSSGEWIQCAIDVRSDEQNFTDLYFYANAASVWRYDGSLGGTEGLFHNLNPYTSSGHFLLKIGGTLIGQALRVTAQPDSLVQTPVVDTTVLTATCHEVDRTMEDVGDGHVGREMLDQGLTQTIPMQVSLDAPGFVRDSTVIRVGYDAQIDSGDSGSLAVQINNENVGIIPSRVGGSPDRNWDHTLVLDPNIQASNNTLNLGITFSSSDVAALAWLDFVELVYYRSTDIGSQSIPFMLMDTDGAFQYQFTSASGGEIWDVTNALAPTIVASANGTNISVALQGQQRAMRQFIAFSSQSAVSPTIAPMAAAPSLRNSVCQTGAAEIIIAPQAFLTEANQLAQLRQEGGQATEAMSAVVVTVESIYQEFGYGNNDIVAIRDFMSYTMHHAATRPMYLTLLGGGHCDYQNKQTSSPDWLPPYEAGTNLDNPGDDPSGFRTSFGSEAYPDDDFFVQLTPGEEGSGTDDLAVGRISARNEADAAVFVSKVQEYEHASDTGAWRSLGTFLADDRHDPEYYPYHDPLDHLGDTQREIENLQDRVVVSKIYEEAYKPTFDAHGNWLYPQVNTAIINAFNNGTVLFSFIGHGNPEVWTHESVLNVPSSIDQLTNFSHLAFVTTATCDFSQYDDFEDFSGGEQFLMQPTGGAIGLLGTSRSVTSGEPLPQAFYQTLFHADPGHGTSTVGEALVVGKASGGDYVDFYLLGDPAQRLLLPKLYVSFDSVNGAALVSGDTLPVADLSAVRISGSIRDDSTQDSPMEPGFNGTVWVTLYDTPSQVFASFVSVTDTVHDTWLINGPILFSGSATVTNGQFTVSFIVPRDAKLDSGVAKFSGYAYSGADARTALGSNEGVHLISSDSTETVKDTAGPSLGLWLGSRAFQSGDEVSVNSTIIVDVHDILGLNTSTAAIGHSFIGWIDDAEDSAIDLSSSYVSEENNFTSGTSEQPISLPAGPHTLHVRAFDTYDNASFASVNFIAMSESPYQLYNVSVVPDPVQDQTTISFVQPGQAGSLVNITLSIYSVDGRLVRTLTASSTESVIDIPWDGRDASETFVANGAYMFIINAQDVGDGTSSTATGKCIVLHQ